jgi:hypothetical protein
MMHEMASVYCTSRAQRRACDGASGMERTVRSVIAVLFKSVGSRLVFLCRYRRRRLVYLS